MWRKELFTEETQPAACTLVINHRTFCHSPSAKVTVFAKIRNKNSAELFHNILQMDNLYDCY